MAFMRGYRQLWSEIRAWVGSEGKKNELHLSSEVSIWCGYLTLPDDHGHLSANMARIPYIPHLLLQTSSITLQSNFRKEIDIVSAVRLGLKYMLIQAVICCFREARPNLEQSAL